MLDRREFIKAAGASAAAMAAPGSIRAVSEETDLERRVGEILSAMSVAEKVDQMSGEAREIVKLNAMGVQVSGATPPNRRLGIPGIRFIDGPRGVCAGQSTCFPVSMARGATFDADLEQRVGRVMGIENRAQGGNFSGGVCVNILRHPSWGRAQETFGEDQHHLGVMGSAMARGMQEHVMACAKHFAANSIEESRFFVDVQIDERTLREVYLPHFKTIVDDGVVSIMSAYNDLNGYLCGHNEWLLRDLLKGEWGFDGFVISDFSYGVEDTVAAPMAGLDIEMPLTMYLGKKLEWAVRSGKVPIEVIDEAVTRIVRHKLRYLHLEDASGYGRDLVACSEHTELAREAAEKGIVLLKNRGGVLPFSRDELGKVAVIGGLADVANIGDNGSSRVTPPWAVSPLEGIVNAAGGEVEVIHDSGRRLSSARKAAARADAAVVVAGFTHKHEGEYIFVIGGDRDDLSLPREQVELIRAVCDENDRVVVVLEAGSAVTMEGWADRAAAIVMAWYPGMEGGNALGDILFGDVNPSGKTPITFSHSAMDLPFFDNKVKEIEYGYYHGYRLFEKDKIEPLFPFGHGLSYTKYRYDNLRLSRRRMGAGESLVAEVDVTNVGEMAGEEVAQLYVSCKGDKVDRPVKDLKGFARVALGPGETGTVSLNLDAKDLAFFNVDSGDWEVESTEYEVLVGPSSRTGDLLGASFKIEGS